MRAIVSSKPNLPSTSHIFKTEIPPKNHPKPKVHISAIKHIEPCDMASYRLCTMYRGGTTCRSHTVAAPRVTGAACTGGGRGAATGGLGGARGSKDGPEEPLRRRPWGKNFRFFFFFPNLHLVFFMGFGGSVPRHSFRRNGLQYTVEQFSF